MHGGGGRQMMVTLRVQVLILHTFGFWTAGIGRLRTARLFILVAGLLLRHFGLGGCARWIHVDLNHLFGLSVCIGHASYLQIDSVTGEQ
jgi:hypothetical protein